MKQHRSFDFAKTFVPQRSIGMLLGADRNSAADPALVSRTPEVLGAGDLAEYEPGSENPIRIWTKDGKQDRQIEPLADDGHFVPASTYAASDIFTYSLLGESRGELYLEGISESELGAVEIVVSVDPDGDAGSAGYVVSDRVRLSVAHVQIVYTDVSGITGTATDIQRIEPDAEPDGLTADWQEGVEDGSLLLMRVVASRSYTTFTRRIHPIDNCVRRDRRELPVANRLQRAVHGNRRRGVLCRVSLFAARSRRGRCGFGFIANRRNRRRIRNLRSLHFGRAILPPAQ
jgi:hypothetical protein